MVYAAAILVPRIGPIRERQSIFGPLDRSVHHVRGLARRYDRSAAVEFLKASPGEDIRVRDAVLESVMNDNDPRIRSAAISLLEPVEADTSVRQVLYSVSNTDDNPQIRNDSRQFLRRVSEIQ